MGELMSAFLWFRSWHGAPMDPKYSVVAARAGVKAGIVALTMWALLDYASQHAKRGTVTGFDTETLATFTGWDEGVIVAVIQAMTDKKIIVDGRLANWEKRQPKREDDSAARVAKFRELKRSVTQCNADSDNETNGNGSVTLSSTLSLIPPPKSSLNSYIPPSQEERIYCAVTRYATIPSGDIDSVCDRIAKLKVSKGCDDNALVEYFRPFFIEQEHRYPGDTRSFWLDWAITGIIPKPGKNGKNGIGEKPIREMTPERKAARQAEWDAAPHIED